jgi:NAD(P)-dependent dehydrogenase (short-subunit alcohol dehydrogenase family)
MTAIELNSEKERLNMDKLKSKVAVITGGTTGIGLATAKLFVAEGAHVFITGRRQDVLDQAIQEIGHSVTGVAGDVSKLDDLDQLFDAVRARGRVDVVFANAGVGRVATLKDVTEDTYEYITSVNIKGTLFTVQKALPLMNDGGSIILTGSVAGVKGTAGFGVYGASKAAIRSPYDTVII